MTKIIAEMRSAVSANRQADYSELNRTLHRRIREISGHSTAAELVAILLNRGAHHRYRLAMVPGRSADSLVEHAAIVDAIVAGDGDRAAEAMHAHLESVQAALRFLGRTVAVIGRDGRDDVSRRTRRPAR